MNNYHAGECCFIIKSLKYYEEYLSFPHVKHNFLTRLSSYSFDICGDVCVDDLVRLATPTPTPTVTLTPTATVTPTLTPTITPTITTT